MFMMTPLAAELPCSSGGIPHLFIPANARLIGRDNAEVDTEGTFRLEVSFVWSRSIARDPPG